MQVAGSPDRLSPTMTGVKHIYLHLFFFMSFGLKFHNLFGLYMTGDGRIYFYVGLVGFIFGNMTYASPTYLDISLYYLIHKPCSFFHFEQLSFDITLKLEQLSFEVTSQCCVGVE